MNKFLSILLEQIELKKEYYSYFEGGILERIIASDNNSKYVFNIDLESVLPYNIYNEFINSIFDTFDSIKEVEVNLFTKKNDYIKDYFINYLDNLNDKSYFLESL